MSTEEFIKKSKQIHGNKYDYSKVEYTNNKTKVCIICPTHGEFYQKPNVHLMNHGCPKCAIENRKKIQKINIEDFVKRANVIHNYKYDYSLVKYNYIKDKVNIICPIHGQFTQRGQDHLNGHGCPQCNNLHKTTEQFIEEAKKVHNNFYTYEKTIYRNKLSKVIITCPIHGDFKQIPSNHLKGCKCPHCSFSKLEKKFEKILLENKFFYEYQKTFNWLGKQRIDFYIPKHNVAIECQGIQHFIPKEHLGGEAAFKETIKRDLTKRKLCQENGVKLLYYTDLKNYNNFQGEKVFNCKFDIINEIKKRQ